MKMYFDKFSEIGSTHKENEDFSVVGDEGHPFVIVSDGCSSSKNTSTGSRILSLCAAIFLKNLHYDCLLNSDDVGDITIRNAAGISNLLRLDQECLDATLMVAYLNKSYNVTIYSWGDGCIFYKHKDTDFEFLKIGYTPEIPYYLSYMLDNDRDKYYKDIVVNRGVLKRESDKEGTYTTDPLLPTQITINGRDLEYILLSTDGIFSFIDMHNNPIEKEIIDEKVNSFKRLNGEFIGRRMNRMLKDFSKDGISHYDDFTISGISFVE